MINIIIKEFFDIEFEYYVINKILSIDRYNGFWFFIIRNF